MEKPAAILLDDDNLIRSYWALSAKKAGLVLTAYANRAEFLGGLAGVPLSTQLYIDAQLGGGERGEDVAKEAHTLGFTEIYLCTGLPPESIRPAPWVKKIYGKDPPW